MSSNLIDKYCNKNGIIKIKVNPCYTSFVGNVQNQYIDPINAAIEIGRRGMFKYKKRKFYPKFAIGTIMDAMRRLNKPRDVSYLKDCCNWMELRESVRKSELRYRATINDAQFGHRVVCNLIHGNMKKICFSSENVLSLCINS